MIQTQHLNTRLSFLQYLKYLITPLVSYFSLRLILMDLEITCRYQGAYIQHCSPHSSPNFTNDRCNLSVYLRTLCLQETLSIRNKITPFHPIIWPHLAVENY